MKRLVILLGIFFWFLGALQAQPMTVRGAVSAGATVNNIYAAFGQPFYQQMLTNGMELAYGVSQAQLDRVEVEDETCENVSYAGNGFNIDASTLTVGTTDYERYDNYVDPYGYDRITVLVLTVWPTYATEASMAYHGDLPVIPGSELQDGTDYQIVEGDNVINYSSEHGCDSVVTLHVYFCPLTVKDADSNEYATVLLDNYCWTQSNLRTTHYFGDAHEAVPMALVYNSDYLDAEAMENTFGRLYTWHSAVKIPEESDEQPALDESGFVRGICPAGWHIPAVPETEAMMTHTGDELRTPTYWIVGAGVNTSGFTLLPAGIYNSSISQFQGLLTMTRHWSVGPTGGPLAVSVEYYCDTPVTSAFAPYDAYSVRCVRNY